MAESQNGQSLERDFSKVILTLDNVLVPEEKLSPTPSFIDGLDGTTEFELRVLGCELIQTSGTLLKLPQVAMACGQVLFQRFYYSKSYVKHDCETVAMACVNLAAKIEESPRRMRDVINVFHHIRQIRSGKTITPMILDQNYIALKNKVIKAERRILKELGFCVHVKHPHKIIVTYLKVLESESNSRLMQAAWNYMNDSFRTDVFVRYTPEAIASACIHLAARHLQIPLPSNPSWFSIFMVDDEEVTSICISILKLYSKPRVNMDAVEKKVNEIKRQQFEAKKKAKGLSSEQGTPNSNSRNVSPKPLSSPLVKKLKSEDDRSDYSGRGDPSRGHRGSMGGARGRSRSRSPRSRSPPRRYKGQRSYSSSPSLSRSRSRSPTNKRNRHSPARRISSKKDRRHSRERYNTSSKHNKRRRSFSRSLTRSLSPRSPKRKSKKYKEKFRSRTRSRSLSYERTFTKKKNGKISSGDKYRR